MAASIDYGDIQGLVRFGHGGMTEACFLLAAVRSPAAARRWLASAPVTSAVTTEPPPQRAMQVAFTWEGLRALGLGERAPGILRRVPLRDGRRGEPLPPPRRRWTERSRGMAMGRSRKGSARGHPALREARGPRELEADDPDRRMGSGVWRDRVPAHVGSGRSRAVRIPGRHQPAGARLEPGARGAGRGDRVRQPPGPGGIPARLSERIREIHGASASRGGGRPAPDAAAGRRRSLAAGPGAQWDVPRPS